MDFILSISIGLFLAPNIVYSSNVCFGRDTMCNPTYFTQCCTRANGFQWTESTYCNMQDAAIVEGSIYPYPVGCCQQCATHEEGCTKLPCCPGFSQSSSCSNGHFCGEDPSTNLVQPDCFTEGQYCRSEKYFKCCDNMFCNMTVMYHTFGKCQRNPGYNGPVPEPLKVPDLPMVPLSRSCKNYRFRQIPTTTTTPPTTPALPTTPAPMVAGASCAPAGARCDNSPCCGELQCSNQWWLGQIIRYVLSILGLAYPYPVCFSYSKIEPLLHLNFSNNYRISIL